MLRIKVCGMRDTANIVKIMNLNIHYLGFIFYPKSPRFVSDLNKETLNSIPKEIEKVGVFVNENIETLIEVSDKYGFSYIQLHGNESQEYCELLLNKRPLLKLIKAINVSTKEDFENIKRYESTCNYLLFDTKTQVAGGSGKKFDWDILDSYTGKLPFFLSGGISMEDADLIKDICHPQLYALDLNSRFETTPAIKSSELLNKFLIQLKNK